MDMKKLKKSTYFLTVIFNIASVIAIIVDIAAVILLGGTLLSQIMRPGYLAAQMVHAELELTFAEWVTLLVCFIIKCSCAFTAIRFTKKLFYCITKEESPFTPNTTKCIDKIAISCFLFSICPLYPYYHFSSYNKICRQFKVYLLGSLLTISRLWDTRDTMAVGQQGQVLSLPVEPQGCFKESPFP